MPRLKSPLRIQVRDVTVELAADDPRVPVIEELVLASFQPPPPPEPVEPPVTPPSPEALLFWDELRVEDRRELLMLAEKPRRPVELAAAMHKGASSLRGRHLRIAMLARRNVVPLKIHARGYGSQHRRYYLDDRDAALVKQLALLPPPT